MIDLYIIGAGNVGGYLAYHANETEDYNIQGFIDDDASKHNQMFCELPILGGIPVLQQIDYPIAVAVAIANPKVKEKIVTLLRTKKNFHYPNFVHPKAWLGQKTSMGEGIIIYPGVSVNYNCKIDDFVTINMNVAIGHDCNLNAYSTLSPGVNLGGFTVVGEKSFLGINANTLQSIQIGRECTIGGGTMVIKNIPDGATVVGNPGRVIKIRE